MKIRRKAGEAMEAIEWTGTNIDEVRALIGFDMEVWGGDLLRVGMIDVVRPGTMICKTDWEYRKWTTLAPGTWEVVE